jgi:hypothetical protein
MGLSNNISARSAGTPLWPTTQATTIMQKGVGFAANDAHFCMITATGVVETGAGRGRLSSGRLAGDVAEKLPEGHGALPARHAGQVAMGPYPLQSRIRSWRGGREYEDLQGTDRDVMLELAERR